GFGHTLSINTTSWVRDVNKYWLYDWVADTVHAQGGLFGYAHALLTHPYIRRGMSLSSPRHKVDFAEILQYGEMGTDFFYDFHNMGFKLAASAGTDVPWQGTIGEVRMYAYIGDQPFSADAWFDAVRKGRTFVTNGPMIDLRVDQAIPGDEIVLKENRKLRIKVRAWGDPERMVPSKLEIVRHGEVIRSTESSDKSQKELSLDFKLESGYGCWIAARAEGSDGSLAHTTPVYVIREPFRFWKIEAIDDLVADRLANLEDIEKLVDRAKEIHEQSKTHERLGLKLMTRQAPELQKRVSEARKFFQSLKQEAERERILRKNTY
ncbi:MAG: CehA/McbA family metallohydrolase, partial [Planctomycetota bacterium]